MQVTFAGTEGRIPIPAEYKSARHVRIRRAVLTLQVVSILDRFLRPAQGAAVQSHAGTHVDGSPVREARQEVEAARESFLHAGNHAFVMTVTPGVIAGDRRDSLSSERPARG